MPENLRSARRLFTPPPRGRGLGGGLTLHGALATALMLGVASSAALAQGPSSPAATPNAAAPDPEEQFGHLQSEAMKALAAKDYPAAEGFLKGQLALQPDSFVVLYNLACARALQDDAPGGLAYLKRAIAKGFVTRSEMEADPMLAPVRVLPGYKDMLAHWDAVLQAHRQANLALAKELFPDARQSASDERLRLDYTNAFHEDSFRAAREELTKLAAWADANVFPGILDPTKMRDDSWVVVVLPSTRDFKKWAVSMFGPDILQGFSTVGGAYTHDTRRLVAQDLGPTLRHEFFHVLHWRSMVRLNQRHPIWIQEGICSLVEDYDMVDGTLMPSTSWRTNTVQRMRSAGVLLPIRKLAAKSNQEFQGSHRMGLYAQSRAVFLYLWQKGKLKDWYQRYTTEFAEDPTGVLSLERAVGMKAEDFDKDFKAWAAALTLVPEEMKNGMPTLGVEVDTGSGEGPVVLSFQKRPTTPIRVNGGGKNAGEGSSAPGSNAGGANAAKPDRLEPGDIITAIDGQPVRDLPELLRRMGTLKPGQTVPISVRRVKLLKEIRVTLGEYRSH